MPCPDPNVDAPARRTRSHSDLALITTELLPEKARRTIENLTDAGVDDLVEVSVTHWARSQTSTVRSTCCS
jgi:predicted O-methyltransferase YrrM